MPLKINLKEVLFLLLLLCNITFLTAQKKKTVGKSLQGVLLDYDTHKPIHNANILYGNKGKGTTSNSNGEFEIFLKKNAPVEWMHFRYVGYKSQTIFFNNKDTVYMKAYIEELEEVVFDVVKSTFEEVLEKIEEHKIKIRYCENFFYKEFLKEDENYINYIEALGVTYVRPNGYREVYLKGKRQTENLSVGFVNFRSNILNMFYNLQELKNCQPLRRSKVDDTTFKLKLWSPVKERHYDLYVDTETYGIKRIVTDDLHDELLPEEMSSQTALYKGRYIKAKTFRQGMSTTIDFKTVDGKQYVNKIIHKSKVCMLSKDTGVQLTYQWNKIYLSTSLTNDTTNLLRFTRFTEKNNFFEKEVKNHIVDWNSENRILPVQEEIEILKELEWKK